MALMQHFDNFKRDSKILHFSHITGFVLIFMGAFNKSHITKPLISRHLTPSIACLNVLFISPLCVNILLFNLLYFRFMLSLSCVCVVLAYFGAGRDVADCQERVATGSRPGARVYHSREYYNLTFLTFSFFLFVCPFHVYV